jgi:DNA polymerase I-like protein with 3'-5' exonuclease and polymerase domains
MKAKLIFKLPEDQKEYIRCTKSLDMASVLWEFGTNSKKSLEWELENKERDSFETLELVFEKFFSLMESNGVNIDEVYE